MVKKNISTLTLTFGDQKTHKSQSGLQLTWPRGFNGSIDLEFSTEDEGCIINLVGEKNLNRVNAIATIYCVEKQYFGDLSIGELNKRFKLIKEKADSLLEILNEPKLQHFFLNMAEKHFGTEYSFSLAKDPTQPSASLKVLKELKSISFVCGAHLATLKPGRPKNTKNFAEYDLVTELYKLCQDVSGGHLTTKPGNLLEEIVKVLRKPLGLGGNLPGIVRRVITENLPGKMPA